MARQRRLPIGRVVPASANLEEVLAKLGTGQRVALFDLVLLRNSKAYAQLKAQSEAWTDEERIDYLLGVVAEGPA